MLAVPQADSAIARRIAAVLLGVALDQQRRRLPAELPGRLRSAPRGYRANRNCGRSATPRAGRGSARRTGPAARDRPSSPASRPAISASPQPATAGRKLPLDPVEHGAGLLAIRRRARPSPRDKPQAPALPAARPYRRRCATALALAGEHRWARPGPRLGEIEVSGSAPRPRSAASARSSEVVFGSRAAAGPGKGDAAAHRVARPPGWPRTHAARRGSAIPSARTETRRACATRSAASSSAAMPQSRSSPAARACSRIAAASGATRRGSPCAGLVIFVDQALELGQHAVAAGAGQGRGQVIDDHRLGSPLGLGALARVVDDERIEMRQRRQARPPGSIRRTAPAPFPAAIRGCRACRDG